MAHGQSYPALDRAERGVCGGGNLRECQALKIGMFEGECLCFGQAGDGLSHALGPLSALSILIGQWRLVDQHRVRGLRLRMLATKMIDPRVAGNPVDPAQSGTAARIERRRALSYTEHDLLGQFI